MTGKQNIEGVKDKLISKYPFGVKILPKTQRNFFQDFCPSPKSTNLLCWTKNCVHIVPFPKFLCQLVKFVPAQKIVKGH